MSRLGASINDICQFGARDLMVGHEAQKQKKSILAAGKLVLFDVKTLRLFFSSREFFFSSIWTAKTSLRSVLTTVRSRKRKILSRKRNFAFEFFHLRATSFQPLGTINIHRLDQASTTEVLYRLPIVTDTQTED